MYEYNVQQTLPHKIWILIAFKAVGVLPVLRECVTIFSTFIFSWFEWFSDIFDHKVKKFWLRSVKMLCLVNKHFILQYFLTWCSPPPPPYMISSDGPFKSNQRQAKFSIRTWRCDASLHTRKTVSMEWCIPRRFWDIWNNWLPGMMHKQYNTEEHDLAVICTPRRLT